VRLIEFNCHGTHGLVLLAPLANLLAWHRIKVCLLRFASRNLPEAACERGTEPITSSHPGLHAASQRAGAIMPWGLLILYKAYSARDVWFAARLPPGDIPIVMLNIQGRASVIMTAATSVKLAKHTRNMVQRASTN
jgi:hypothetical protein